MISIDQGVIEYVKEEARKGGLKTPMVLIMDCGCMMDQESIELDIKEENLEEGYEFYLEKDRIKFYIKPKVRHLAERGRISVATYGAGKYKRLEYNPL